MVPHAASLVAFLVAVSFASGLNVYATVATLGLLSRFHLFSLPLGLGGLTETLVIAAALAMFALEFVADKIPMFDLVWNALHTFVRLPVAAIMAYRASAHLSPAMQIAVTLTSAAVALLAHGSKTAARVMVTPSPEPVSNIALSGAGDVAAVGLTWVATRHPFLAGGAAFVALLALALLFRSLYRTLQRQMSSVRKRLSWPRAASLSSTSQAGQP